MKVPPSRGGELQRERAREYEKPRLMQGPRVRGRVLLGLLVRTTLKSGLLIRGVLRHERRRVILTDLVQSGGFVLQRDAKMSVGDGNEFRPKRRRDELRLVVRSVRLLFDQRRDGRSMSSI